MVFTRLIKVVSLVEMVFFKNIPPFEIFNYFLSFRIAAGLAKLVLMSARSLKGKNEMIFRESTSIMMKILVRGVTYF